MQGSICLCTKYLNLIHTLLLLLDVANITSHQGGANWFKVWLMNDWNGTSGVSSSLSTVHSLHWFRSRLASSLGISNELQNVHTCGSRPTSLRHRALKTSQIPATLINFQRKESDVDARKRKWQGTIASFAGSKICQEGATRMEVAL